MRTRLPAFEGTFYPGSAREITRQIEFIENGARYPVPDLDFSHIIGGILPHAGHIYSGYQTVPFFQFLKNAGNAPETVIILHPNHSGSGPAVASTTDSYWQNSLGKVRVDEEMRDLLPYPTDSRAHRNEHSCEVIIPYIQHYLDADELTILPVAMSRQNSKEAMLLGKTIFQVVKSLEREVLVIASSDFSHFLTADQGYDKDQLLIDQIMKRNIPGIEKTIHDNRISACGYGPIMSLMAFSSYVSPNYRSKILARGHSGEVTPSNSVVDYISMLFYC